LWLKTLYKNLKIFCQGNYRPQQPQIKNVQLIDGHSTGTITGIKFELNLCIVVKNNFQIFKTLATGNLR
jgi:hypothetical protein